MPAPASARSAAILSTTNAGRQGRCVLALTAVVLAISVCRMPAADGWSFDPATTTPFWRAQTMHGESVLPVRAADGQALSPPLLFVPEQIISVTSSAGDKVYQPGRDYTITPGIAAVNFPLGTTIPLIDPAKLTVKPGTQPYALTRRDGSGEVLFGAKLEWQDMQVVVTYTHADTWTGAAPAFAGTQLPRTAAKLNAHQPLRVTLLGDSISVGANASKFVNLPPFQPAYAELFTQALHHAYGSEIALDNRSVGGQTAKWGATQIAGVINAKPDLMLIAFGMNDAAGGVDGPAFNAAVLAQITGVRAALPHCEFILVASFPGNGEWSIMDTARFPVYRDVLAQLCGPGVALADVTTLWNDLLKKKHHRDVTGNGVNHPNDFGHRLYAQVLTALLVR